MSDLFSIRGKTAAVTGVAWGAPVDTHPIEQVDRVLQVNVRAVFRCTQRLLPLLRAAASAEDPARVINIGSVDGLTIPFWPNYWYSASKAAVHILTRHLATPLCATTSWPTSRSGSSPAA